MYLHIFYKIDLFILVLCDQLIIAKKSNTYETSLREVLFRLLNGKKLFTMFLDKKESL